MPLLNVRFGSDAAIEGYFGLAERCRAGIFRNVGAKSFFGIPSIPGGL